MSQTSTTNDIMKEIDEILARDNLKKQKEEWQLKPYESFHTKGVVLVDGNHSYLEAVNTFQSFNESFERHELLFGDINFPNIYCEITGKHLADHTAETLDRLTSVLSYRIAQDVGGTDKNILDRRSILQQKPDPSSTMLLLSKMETFIFDAKLPPRKNTIDKLKKQFDAATSWNQRAKRDTIKAWLDMVRAGEWRTFHDGHYLKVRYELKDEFLEALTRDEYINWRAIYGRKHINIGNKGDLYQKEKGVDTLLVIKGCEVADQSDIDFVCIVTNDSDYEPLIDHIKSKGKKVYLYSSGNPNRISKILQKSVEPSNSITVKDVISDFDPVTFNREFSQDDGIYGDAVQNPSIIPLVSKCMFKRFVGEIEGWP